ncbi:MAG: ABC transporter ATP-binding protein/permease [Clostridia bacterium]|nr:ABC transporter ATP-binding protein/permease [Clostridia bacterium]
MLNLKNVKKDYATSSETVHALRGISIAFRKNEFVSILGPSGCGKTTLLNIIGGLDHYTDGDLVINGKSTKAYRDRDWDVYRNHRVGFIFQSYNLIPHQTVLSNVELSLTIAGIGKEERTAKAKLALDRVGLAGQYYKKPNQLSGGQCQRVAIARALVNDPEILLADEPTGALDTATSVQIMDLIREISKERLVIMVTHNPELAEQYSSRIVRLLDGNIMEDTNPLSDEDEAAELATAAKEEAELAAEGAKKSTAPKRERAKMSFFTAFMLSLKNLLSKKGRTALVGFAGSIGIIGIALVLAFSAGIKGYIASMQDDMLSGNPITITETAYDLDMLSGMMDTGEKVELIKEPNRVYINSLIKYMVTMQAGLEDFVSHNEITQEYVDFVKAMDPEYYEAMTLGYGINLGANLFTDYKNIAGEDMKVSVQYLTDMYTALLSSTEYASLAYLIPTLAPSIAQAPPSSEYISQQYDILSGKLAEGKNEIMLVVDRDDELSDLLLIKYGYFTGDEFITLIEDATKEDKDAITEGLRNSYTYEELLGKTFTYYPTDNVFGTKEFMGKKMYSYSHNALAEGFNTEGGIDLEVVGIISPKDNTNYGCLQSGIYYTEALTNEILDLNRDSEFLGAMKDMTPEEIGTSFTQSYGENTLFGVMYMFDYYTKEEGETVSKKSGGVVSYGSGGMQDMMGSSMGSETTNSERRDRFIRTYGGNDVANSITIYPISFDSKSLVTDYLDKWNSEDPLTVNGTEIGTRAEISYTDTLELIISIINTMIDVISYALIAFTSVSLVVSTVMIGIITYVSVVERIKEIGVIRSLGGRKRDVSYLFNAETFIIGLLAGLIGIGATYLISGIVNLILTPLINYSGIAALPISQAILLVCVSIGLTLISGLIPASSAAKKDPVVALRTE